MAMDWDKAEALIAPAENVAVVAHVSPDGDAIGALLGMTLVLRKLGKRVIPLVDGGVPKFLRFLPSWESVVDVWVEDVFPQPDVVIAVDCGDAGRMGELGAAVMKSQPPLINIDHHVTNTQFGDANLVDVDTVSTTEGLLNWLPRLGVDLDVEVATCLLTGLVTDTLCFRTDNVTAPVLGKAQQLMAAGADLSAINQRTVMRKSFTDIKLWAAVLPSVKLHGNIIWAAIDRETRRSLKLKDNGDGGLVGLLLSADEAFISAVFREKEDGRVEIGFRAVPGFDVSGVALALGGGGHALASGATVAGPLDDVIQKTLRLLRNAAKEGAPVVS